MVNSCSSPQEDQNRILYAQNDERVNEKLTHKSAHMKLEKLEKGSEDTPVPHGKDVALNFQLRAGFILLHGFKLHWQFWDPLEINASKEDTESAELKAFNFQWTSHVDDIENRSLVSASGEAEVINADIVPDLRDEDVGNHGEEFDDLFIYFSSCSDFSSSDEDGESLPSDDGRESLPIDAGSDVDDNCYSSARSSEEMTWSTDQFLERRDWYFVKMTLFFPVFLFLAFRHLYHWILDTLCLLEKFL
ncbi:hypothetical protein TIFTF001_030898 [Ficus carica]|uniref:Uncharacterized protein n=1 Tax=Ficus carica TaxID=3494 RepID=A0AA88DU18_FICCA|nr:hypothetical protein TIFTF001_030898 [Ficus carica]